MKEVKTPKKPLLYYYGIVLLIIFLFNLLVTPILSQRQVTEVDYGTFMDMIEEQNIGVVQVEDCLLYTSKPRKKAIREYLCRTYSPPWKKRRSRTRLPEFQTNRRRR